VGQLLKSGFYRYDPKNFHGPLLFWLMAPVVKLFGPDLAALRAVPALAGVLLVVLAGGLHRELGRASTVAAAVLLACSPTLVYYSRFMIHEIFLGLFTLVFVAALCAYGRRRKAWHMAAAGLALGAMVSMKETYVISLACLLAAWLVSGFAYWITSRRQEWVAAGWAREMRSEFAERRHAYAWGLAACVAVIVLLYTSFGREWASMARLDDALGRWAARGALARHHAKPMLYFGHLLEAYEGPIAVLAVLGTVLSFAGRDSFGMFVSAWTWLSFLAYSLIPYKTPWCAVQILVPACLAAGKGVGLAWRAKPRILRTLSAGGNWLAVLSVPVLIVWVGVAVRLNWREPADPRHPQAYAQATRDILPALALIRETAGKTGLAFEMPISIVAPQPWQHWALWGELAQYKNLRWSAHEADLTAPLVIVHQSKLAAAGAQLSSGYAAREFDWKDYTSSATFYVKSPEAASRG